MTTISLHTLIQGVNHKPKLKRLSLQYCSKYFFKDENSKKNEKDIEGKLVNWTSSESKLSSYQKRL